MRAKKEQVIRDIKMYLGAQDVSSIRGRLQQGHGPGSADAFGALREKGHQL